MTVPEPAPSPCEDFRSWLRPKLRRAWWVLLWERLWRAGWPAVTVTGLFVALALLDVLPALGGPVHAGVLVLFALVLLGALVHVARTVRPPTRDDLVDRLDRDAGSGAGGAGPPGGRSGHRPLRSLDDTLAAGAGDPVSRALWDAHLDRMAEAARRLRVGLPSPGVPAREPWGLRAGVVMLLVIGITAGHDDPGPRLERALSPRLPAVTRSAATVRLWITPPAYTGAQPLTIEGGAGLPPATPAAPASAPAIEVPVGSTVLAMVFGGDVPPDLVAEGRRQPFAALGDGSYRLETTLGGGGQDGMEVVQGGESLGRWPLSVRPDTAPVVAFTAPPAETGRFRLQLAYEATDDYGLSGLGALIERPGGRSAPFDLALAVSELRPRSVRTSTLQDLTAHPWAGLEVSIRLYARDAAGHTGLSDPAVIRLPERVFNHPVARLIAEQRRRMLAEPEAFADVLTRLDAIAAQPAAYDGDPVVFLALRVARFRVSADPTDDAVDSARDMLWQTAVRIEDGRSAADERAVVEAERALTEALARGADPAELQRLIEAYRQAVEQYMSSLAERLRQGDAPMMPMPNGRTLKGDDLARLFERMNEMARIGAADAARQLLSEMQQLMQSLRGARMMSADDPALRQARDMMERLRGLADREQALLDETFALSQQPRRPANRQRLRAMAETQEAIRRDLGELLQHLAEGGMDIPRSLGQAELAMRGAGGRLQAGDGQAAAEAEGRALHELRQGTREALQSMLSRMAGPGGMTLMPGGSMPSGVGAGGSDPLGRHGGGNPDDGSVAVPSEAEARSARDILDELRRRASERHRPRPELEYLDRLLRQF